MQPWPMAGADSCPRLPMPRAVDEMAMGGLQTMDPNKPPTRDIEMQEFPRLVYKYPTAKFRTERKLDSLNQVVEVKVANEHTHLMVENSKELDKAVKAGWQLKPYIPADPDGPEAEN